MMRRVGLLLLVAFLMTVPVVMLTSGESDAAATYEAEVVIPFDRYCEIDLRDHLDGEVYNHVMHDNRTSDADYPPGMTRDGYVISGTPQSKGTYQLGFKFTNATISFGADAVLSLTIRVEVIPLIHTVTYDAGVGTVNGSQTWSEEIVEDGYASLPDAVYSGGAYDFIGWSMSKDSASTVDPLRVTGDVTLHAVWERNTVDIDDLEATVLRNQSSTLRIPVNPASSVISVSTYGGLPAGSVQVSGDVVHLDMTGITPGTYHVGLSASYTGYYTGTSVLTIRVPIHIVEPVSLTLSVGEELVYTPVTEPSNAVVSITHLRFDGSDMPDSGCFGVDGRTIRGIPSEPGTYELTFSVDLPGYAGSTDTLVIHVSDVSSSDPVALTSVAYAARPGTQRIYDFFAMGGSNVSSYTWSVNGEVFASSSPTAVYEFPTAGVYTVDCTARGLSGDTVTISQTIVCTDNPHRQAAWSGVAYGVMFEGEPLVRLPQGSPFRSEVVEHQGIPYTHIHGTPTESDVGRSFVITVGDESWVVTVHPSFDVAPVPEFTVTVSPDHMTVTVSYTGIGDSFHWFDFDGDGIADDGTEFTYRSAGVHTITCTAVNNVSTVSVSKHVTTGGSHIEVTPLGGLTDFTIGVGERLDVSISTVIGDVLSVTGDTDGLVRVDGSILRFNPIEPGEFHLKVTLTRADGTSESREIKVTVPRDPVDAANERADDYLVALCILFVFGLSVVALFIIHEYRNRGPPGASPSRDPSGKRVGSPSQTQRVRTGEGGRYR